MQPPPVGTTVLFYLQGDANVDPIVGLVQYANAGGALELATFPRFSSTVQIRRNVLHMDDSVLVEKPNLRKDYGAWDTIKGAEKRRKEQEDKAREVARKLEEAAKERDAKLQQATQEEIDAIVRLKREKNLGVQDIAEEMTKTTKHNWSADRILAILRKQSQLVAT